MDERSPHQWPPPLATRVSRMFGIRYPIIQAGMAWTAGKKLAVAVSEAGGLGLIGAGTMKVEMLREHIRAALAATPSSVGVNITLNRGDAEDLVRATIEEGIRIVFTASGTPMKYTAMLKAAGCTVVHVIAAVKHARKAEVAGCDAVVAEGYEAGGHNGVDEITTMTLVPQIVDAVKIPVIAAGGIADGRGMAAGLALGAEGVQVGTRFAATVESASHETYKRLLMESGDGGTILTMRKLMPVRMLKTPFALKALEAERRGASKEELEVLLGRKREKLGIGEGNIEEGMFDAGQSSGLVHDIPTAGEVVRRMMKEYYSVCERMARGSHDAIS
jgi:enoyl-[acyl-carrier protein] reductase II